jgi:precorrin-6B methylase 2
MNSIRRYMFLAAFMTLFVPPLGAQVNSDVREKTEKVAEVLAALEATPGKHIADVGLGDGSYAVRIARAVAPNGHVTAVDVDPNTVAKLRRQLASEKIKNADVVFSASADPKLSPASYDAILVYNAYHEISNDRAMRTALFDALKPGGRIVVVEPLHDNLRDAPREVQLKEREISPVNVGIELTEVGFSVIDVRPQFVPFTDPKHKGGHWLMIATKPSKKF